MLWLKFDKLSEASGPNTDDVNLACNDRSTLQDEPVKQPRGNHFFIQRWFGCERYNNEGHGQSRHDVERRRQPKNSYHDAEA
jgi:hypothetical protein